MRFTRKTVAGVAIVGVLALGATIPALAQDTGDDTGTESTQDWRELRRAEREERQAEREAHRAQYVERVAEIVGVEADDLAAAMDQVKDEMREEHAADRLAHLEERLASAVDNGRLTQEEADEMLERARDGEPPFRGRGMRGMNGNRGMGGGFGLGTP